MLSGAVRKVTSSLTLLWMREDLPRTRGMERWRTSHAQLVLYTRGVAEYRQHHLRADTVGLWPAIEGVETTIPDERRIDGIPEVTFRSAASSVLARDNPDVNLDEQNVFGRTILCVTPPNGTRWFSTDTNTRTTARAVVLFRCRSAAASRHHASKVIHEAIGPALADIAGVTEVRTMTFLPHQSWMWTTPGVSHDNPPSARFHGAIILGAANEATLQDVLRNKEITELASRISEAFSAVHAYAVAHTYVYRQDGRVALPSEPGAGHTETAITGSPETVGGKAAGSAAEGDSATIERSHGVMGGFSGKVAVITGAGSGIGRALAQALAAEGVRLALSDKDPCGLAETRRLVEQVGAEVDTAVVDVSDRRAVFDYADAVVRRFAAADQLYNNAGVEYVGGFGSMDLDDYETLIRVNLWGVVFMTKALLPALIASGDGRVVNISSLFGLLAVPRQTAYSSSKFAVRGFTEGLRSEMIEAGHPVKVTYVCPSSVRSAVFRHAMTDSSYAPGTVEALDFSSTTARVPANAAARTILRGVRRGVPRILVGSGVVPLDVLVRIFGPSYTRAAAKLGGSMIPAPGTVLPPSAG